MPFVTKMALSVTKLCPLVRVAARGPVLCESATPKCFRVSARGSLMQIATKKVFGVSERGSPGYFAAKIAFVVADEGYSLLFVTKMTFGAAI